jgi:hypothetical protein
MERADCFTSQQRSLERSFAVTTIRIGDPVSLEKTTRDFGKRTSSSEGNRTNSVQVAAGLVQLKGSLDSSRQQWGN